MSYGRLDRDTAAARVYRYLLNHKGMWLDGWTLTMATKTSAISTRISEIRQQLPENGRYAVERKQEGQAQYYRIVEREGDMALFEEVADG